MTERNQDPPWGTGQRPPSTDQILDLLLDALAERQRARQGIPSLRATPSPEQQPRMEERGATPSSLAVPGDRAPQPAPSAAREVLPTRPAPPVERRTGVPPAAGSRLSPPAPKSEPGPGEEGWKPPSRLPSINMGKTLGRLLILIVVLTIVINIPVTRHGVSLARIMPESSSLVIRDGLVLKGSGSEIYILEDDKLRWISSMDAFEHLDLAWKDVHVVDDAFLTRFEKGRPIHVLLKCSDSPHIYRLENDQKRWIKDIDTFLAEGHVWEDVRAVSCDYLRSIPDGPPIPEDAGPPPQP
ncbi:MAG: hypothetical protein JXM73_19240 [Anaerolineae bacterium]|nr:hypothetical protein [Anaerolineae bacterium]